MPPALRVALCAVLLVGSTHALSLDGRDRRLLRACASRSKSEKTMPTLAFAGDGAAAPRAAFVEELRSQLDAHELVLVRMPSIGKKREAKLYAEAQLIPMLGDETHLVQTLGHTVLLYAPHPSAPRLAAELGLGARQAGEPSDGDAP